MKRIWLILACAALPAVVFAGGGGQRQGANYLRFAWWGNTVRDERTKQVMELFQQRNPGVTVEAETTGWDDYWTKLNTQAAAGSLPDLMQQSVAEIVRFNNSNLLDDLNVYARQGLIDLSQWDQSSLGSGMLDGKLIALTLGTNAWGMAADPAILQRAGVTIDDASWTWADYERIALQIYRSTGVQTAPFSNFDQIPRLIVRSFGNPMFSRDGKSLGWTAGSPAFTAVKEILFDMQLRLQAAGALFDVEAATDATMEDSTLATGATWNGFIWSNTYIGYLRAAGKPLALYLSPSPNGNTAPYGTFYQASMLISMLNASKNKDLTAKFIDFFVNNVDANRILLAERGIPLPSNVRNDLSSRVDADTKYTFDFIGRIAPYTSPIDPPSPSTAAEVLDMTSPIILQGLTGRLSSDAAMTQIVQTANRVLGQ